ncbi:MAG: fluoride efflux transporter CrcB [Saprospiraceae bacterium]
MKIILLIGIGSFIGGVSRYLLSQLVQQKTLSTFPYGTLLVNILGCLFIGIVFGLAAKGNMSQEMKLFFATGLLGGFTTFSAFSNETITLFNTGHSTQAALYVFASVVIGLGATVLGLMVTRFIL